MKRPARVRVLGKRYVIEYVPEADPRLNDPGEDNAGICKADDQLILIAEGRAVETEQDTVLHEVMHAVEDAMGLNLDENVIRLMTTGMLAVLKDNPGFVSYLRAKAVQK